MVAGARDAHHHPLLARRRPIQPWLWGYTFPLGVYTVATFRLGTTLNLGFFGIVGTVLTVALAAMWLLVGAKTLAGAWRGNLFVSPCIATPN